MSNNELIRFQRLLANHTAPALLGIKPSSLVSLNSKDFDIKEHIKIFNDRAMVKGLKIKILCKCKNRVLILLYNESILNKQVSNNRYWLDSFGYKGLNLEECLNRLGSRLVEFEEFPHEIGIFLGYPIEDVIGFIQNKGKNYKLCGYWKVYGDECKAKCTFENYDKCRKYLCNRLNQGVNIYQALKIA